MSEYESRLSALMHEVAPEPPSEIDIDAILANQPAARPRKWLGPVAAAALVLALALGVALASTLHTRQAQHSSAVASRPGLPTRSVAVTAAPSPISGAGYPAVAGKVAIYVVGAPSRISSAITSFDVEIILVNSLGRPFSVNDACNGWLGAGLSSTQFRWGYANGQVGCNGITVPEGTSETTRQISTRYSQCSQDLSTPPTVDDPRCLPPDQGLVPKLPAGNYHLTLDTSQIPQAVEPHPVLVTITSP